MRRCMSAIGTKRTSACALQMSAIEGKADMAFALQMSAFDPKRTLDLIATRRPVAKC